MPGQLSQQGSVSVSNAASTQIAADNPKRTAITFDSPTANRVTLSFFGAATLDQGPTIQPGTSQRRFSLEEHGEIVQRAIQGIAATAPTRINYIEEFDW